MEFTEINKLINELNKEVVLLNDELIDFIKINNDSFCKEEIEVIKNKINVINENNNQIINKL